VSSSNRLRTRLAAATDVGRRRSGNEDCHAVWESHGRGPADVLLVVCDGMGGSNAGEVASRMTVDAVLRHFERDPGDDAGAALARALEAANTEVWQHTRTRPDLEGMGTTCTALALRGDEAVVAHVGDSRAYRVRDGRIRQVTQDHSLVAQLVASGQLTPEAARADPRRNVVTRSVGISPSLEVDLVRLDEPLRAGDTFLLCSDGLHGQVGEGELVRLASGESLEQASLQLIDLANQRGGPDNITVVLARLEEREDAARSRARPSRGAPGGSRATKRRTLQLLILALVALTITLCGVAWMVAGMMRADRVPAAETGAPAGERDR
jgi:PPM family protein phosphatase